MSEIDALHTEMHPLRVSMHMGNSESDMRSLALVRELPQLIAEEKDTEKLKVLAAELERLLSVEQKLRPIVPHKKTQSG